MDKKINLEVALHLKSTRRLWRRMVGTLVSCGLVVALSACSSLPDAPATLSSTTSVASVESAYLIGPSDQLNINVWHQPELSSQPIVRPDGRISIPLIEDMPAAGRTPTQLGAAIAGALKEYVQEPKVTVIVTNFVGPFDRQIRVIGEAARPQAIPYRHNMTTLDVMIQVGGLTEFASGNRAILTRPGANGATAQRYRLRLDDLLNNGDIAANAYVMPGDVIVIPHSYF
jgi:polysaccharide export outer membrane protein